MNLSILRTPEDEILNREARDTADVFFVVQRSNGHWSPGAKIMRVFSNQFVAETYAAEQKRLHPMASFGVAHLLCEARQVANPIEIVRVGGEA